MTKLFAKIAGSVAVVALAAVVAVPSASALSAADIQLLVSLGVIPADKADAAMALAGGSSSSSSHSCGTYTRDLTLGSTGADVVSLQTMLESKGHLTIPAGVSKGYFGPLTQSALASYQASVGIAPAAGYFGPVTRSHVASTCSVMDDDDMMDDDDDMEDLSGDEASLADFNANSKHSNENLEEGETNFVLSVDFEVDDGDASLQRVDVKVEAVDESLEDEPWKQIEELALYLDGEMIASKDVDDEDAWSRESSNSANLTTGVSGNKSYKVRFSGLSEKLEEGEEPELEVEVTVRDDIDDSDLEQSWAIWIPANGVRAVDGSGIDQYTGSDSEEKEFDIEAADDGNVEFQTSDDDPDASILVVDTNDKSDTFEVFRFELDNEDADIFLNTLTITASSTDADIDDVISELMVEIDGETYDFDTASTSGGGNWGEYEFDFEDNDDEVPVEEDETIDIVVWAIFNQQLGNYVEGTLVDFGIGNLGTTAGTAEGQQSGDASTVSGSVTSEIHSLRAAGISIEGLSESAVVDEPEVAGEIEEGIFELEVEITALDDDAFIPDSVGTSASSGAGFVISITNSGTPFTGTTTAFIAEDTASTETANRHKVNDDDSERFTIRIELDPTGSASGNAFGIELDSVRFATSSTNALGTYTVPDEDEFETKKVTID